MWLKCSQSGSYPWDSRAPLPPAAGCGGVLCSGLFHHGQPLLPPPSLLEESHVKPDGYTPPSLLRAEGDICFGSRGSTVEMVWQHQEESPEEAGSLCCSSLRCLCSGAVVACVLQHVEVRGQHLRVSLLLLLRVLELIRSPGL